MKLDELPWTRAEGDAWWEHAFLACGGDLARSLLPDATLGTPSVMVPVGTIAYCAPDAGDFKALDKLTAECLAHEHFHNHRRTT